MKRRLFDGQQGFAGGLNLAADVDLMAPNEVRRAAEAVLDQFGESVAIKKRPGVQRLHDLTLHASGVQNGFAWLKADGTQQLVVVVNGQVHTATYALGATFTPQAGTLATGMAPGMVAFRDAFGEVVYFADGAATALNKWDGAAVNTNIASTPTGIRFLEIYFYRLTASSAGENNRNFVDVKKMMLIK